MNTPEPREAALPTLTVVAGPARSGKTSWCLDRLRESPSGVWLIADAGCERVRGRAESAGDADGAARDRVFDSGHLLDVLDRPASARRRIGPTLQRIFLEEAVASACTQDGPFHRASETRGFVIAIRAAIRELKLARSRASALEAAASAASAALDDPEFVRKMHELAAVWAAYEGILHRYGCRDDEDRVADAAANVTEGRARLPKVLLVDGRRRIEPLWRDLLAAAAARGCEVAITLPDDPARPQLFAATARALADLRAEFDVRVERLEPRASQTMAPALAHLERGLFGSSPKAVLPGLTESPIVLFDAPSPYAEAEMIARELLRRHTGGMPWNRCAVIVRSASVQAPVVAAVLSERYGIPTALRLKSPVAEHPVVQTLLTLLDIFSHDWRRADVVRYLKSTYSPVNQLAADLLRRKLHRSRVRDGRESWAPGAVSGLTTNGPLLQHLEAMLAWDARLTSQPKPANDLVADIEEILGAAIAFKQPDPDANKALNAAKGVLNEIALASALRGEGPVPLAELASRMAAQCVTALYHAGAPEDGTPMVEVMEPDEAHALNADWCAVMGMTERVFPRRVAEDPFIRDDERAALAAAGGPCLSLRRCDADDERLRFYLAATTPSKRLILSFPRATEEQDALPSFYLDDVRALYEHVPALVATLAEVVPPRDQAATPHEALLAECAEGLREAYAPMSDDAAAVLAARSQPAAPRIDDAEERGRAAHRRRFDMTQLETYLVCPFQHFANHVLSLREETTGTGPTERGSILHRVLVRTMRRLHGSTPGEEDLRAALREDLAHVLAGYAVDAPAHLVRMMRRALTEALDGFAEREARFRGVFGAAPTYYELAFGQHEDADDDDRSIDSAGERARDPASKASPLMVAAGEAGPPVEVSGTIDRVDLLPRGRALVMDYKLGHGVRFDEMLAGASLQMPVYMLAIEQLWDHPAAVACYDSVRDKGRPRIFRRSAVHNPDALRPIAGVENGHAVKPMNEDEYTRLLQVAEDSVRRAAAGLRTSDILPRPGKHCDLCAYQDLCRTNTAREHDGEDLPEA